MTIQDKIFTNFSDWHKAYQKRDIPIFACKIEDELHPFEAGAKDIFIPGKGRVKIAKKKVIEVELPTLETNLDEYLAKYGKYVMFYVLTRQLLNYWDVAWSTVRHEFQAIVEIGFEKWITALEGFRELQAIVTKVYAEKYGIIPDNDRMQTTKQGTILFRDNIYVPSFNHYVIYPIRQLPSFDPVADDHALWITFVKCERNGDFENVNEDTDFPLSLKDRLVYIFGERAAELYKPLINPFI